MEPKRASSLEPRMHAILMLPELLKLAPVLLKSKRERERERETRMHAILMLRWHEASLK